MKSLYLYLLKSWNKVFGFKNQIKHREEDHDPENCWGPDCDCFAGRELHNKG